MKNLLMIAIALVTLNATAQQDRKEVRKAHMKERMADRQSMTPEEIATLQTKKMTLYLDLDDKQQAQVNTVLLEEASNRKAKIAEYKATKESGEKQSKEEYLKRKNAKLDHQIAMKRKMKDILNAEQYAKFEKMQSKRDGKKRSMRHKIKNRK